VGAGLLFRLVLRRLEIPKTRLAAAHRFDEAVVMAA
jgi:hypothetical protein